MPFSALKSGLLVPAGYKPDKGPVAGEDELRARSHRDTSTPADGLTPAGLIRVLRDAAGGNIVEQAKLFRDMEERDSIIGAHMATRRAGVLSCGWQIVPDEKADDEAAAQAAADLCQEAVDALDGAVGLADEGVRDRGGFDDVLRMLLDALGKGFRACPRVRRPPSAPAPPRGGCARGSRPSSRPERWGLPRSSRRRTSPRRGTPCRRGATARWRGSAPRR